MKQRESCGVPRSSWKHGFLSKIMPKHDEDEGDIGKKIRRTAEVSVHEFDATANKKAHIGTLKAYLCQGVRRSAAYRIIVNKIK
jgi:hypothetical protein